MCHQPHCGHIPEKLPCKYQIGKLMCIFSSYGSNNLQQMQVYRWAAEFICKFSPVFAAGPLSNCVKIMNHLCIGALQPMQGNMNYQEETTNVQPFLSQSSSTSKMLAETSLQMNASWTTKPGSNTSAPSLKYFLQKALMKTVNFNEWMLLNPQLSCNWWQALPSLL